MICSLFSVISYQLNEDAAEKLKTENYYINLACKITAIVAIVKIKLLTTTIPPLQTTRRAQTIIYCLIINIIIRPNSLVMSGLNYKLSSQQS